MGRTLGSYISVASTASESAAAHERGRSTTSLRRRLRSLIPPRRLMGSRLRLKRLLGKNCLVASTASTTTLKRSRSRLIPSLKRLCLRSYGENVSEAVLSNFSVPVGLKEEVKQQRESGNPSIEEDKKTMASSEVSPLASTASKSEEAIVEVEGKVSEIGSSDEIGKPKTEEPSDPFQMEIPNDKENSGAKIQSSRGADADPQSTATHLELVEDINKAEKLKVGYSQQQGHLPCGPVEKKDEHPGSAQLVSNEYEKTEIGSSEEKGKCKEKTAESQPGSGRQEVPYDKDNSSAKIQSSSGADAADTQSTSTLLELVGTLEDINKAEKLKANAGGSPSRISTPFEQEEIKVPNEKVGLIIGKAGETLRNIMGRSFARIEFVRPSHSDEEQSKERIVRITGQKRQIESARDMIKDVINQTVRQSPSSSGYSQQQGHLPCGPVAPQFCGYEYPQYQFSYNFNYPPPVAPRSNSSPGWDQRPPTLMHMPLSQGNYNYGHHPGPEYWHHPSFQTQSTPKSYTHGYKEAKYGPPPHVQPYGQQPRPNQPVEAPKQGPAQMYVQSIPLPQQQYPYAPSGPMYPNPPYGSAPASAGYGQTYPNNPPAAAFSGYGQPVVGSMGGFSMYPAAYEYQAPVYLPSQQGPLAHCIISPTDSSSPGYNQSGGYGYVEAAAPVVER